jgi:Na+/H+ antiporter NhaC
MTSSNVERRDFFSKRYGPIQRIATGLEYTGTALLVLSLCLGAYITQSMYENSDLPYKVVSFLVPVVFGFFGFVLCLIASSVIRSVIDTALWTAPGLSEDEKISVAKGL